MLNSFRLVFVLMFAELLRWVFYLAMNLDRINLCASVGSFSNGFQSRSILLWSPYKKATLGEWLVFSFNHYATFDIWIYTLCDITYSGERWTSTHLICSNFWFAQLSLLSLYYHTRLQKSICFRLDFDNFCPLFVLLDELSCRIKIFIWYQRWKWAHAEDISRWTGKSCDCLS